MIVIALGENALGKKKEFRERGESYSRLFPGTYPQGEEKISVDIRRRKEL
jgi:hypothetical protein